MFSRTLAAMVVLATLWPGMATAQETPSLAQLIVDSGEFSGADQDFWVGIARLDRDRAEFRKIVERETRRMEAERAAAAPQEPVIDPKLNAISGPLKDYLERMAALEQVADPKLNAISGPLKDYLERMAALEQVADPKLNAISGPLKDYLEKQARMSALVEARAQSVGGGLKTAQAVERWTRVVVDSTGEVIENDPVDVAHARLEDLSRRWDEVARPRPQSSAAEFRETIAELSRIDAQINGALTQIAGVVWRKRAALRGICHPHPEKGQPVAWYNCEYWATGLPKTLGGGQIILDRVKLEIDEDATDAPYQAHIHYYWHYSSEAPKDEPASGGVGEVRHGPKGGLSLAFTETDEDGELRERLGTLALATGAAVARVPGFDGYGPLVLKFRRDPSNYMPWADYQATLEGRPPERRSDWSDSDLIDISKAAAQDEVELIDISKSDGWGDDDLIDINNPPPLTKPPAPGDDDLIDINNPPPLTKPPAPGDDDLIDINNPLPLTKPPAPGDDDLIDINNPPPLTKPPASGDDDLFDINNPPAKGSPRAEPK